ncbi:hypothetical protein CMUS01_07301 [Colletotrichum musicola]|uniref:Uncharacterized protein n=1 Tax=Colletotrichum musicola TaxID=2175873 RepID=A0A8H6KHR5_9PEZI|nr:hypothetical protein CMUS01_07301 [Colletotrichum musicola]
MARHRTLSPDPDGDFTTVTYARTNAANGNNARMQPTGPAPQPRLQQSGERHSRQRRNWTFYNRPQQTQLGQESETKYRSTAPTAPRLSYASVNVGDLVWAHNVLSCKKGRPAYVWRKQEDNSTVIIVPISSGERANSVPRITSGDEIQDDRDSDLRLAGGRRMIKRSWLICHMAVAIEASKLKPYYDGTYVPESNWMSIIDSQCGELPRHRRVPSMSSESSLETDLS